MPKETTMEERFEKEFGDVCRCLGGPCDEYNDNATCKIADKLLAFLSSEVERGKGEVVEEMEPEMNRKLQATMMWIADYAYRKANPGGKMDTPSIVYEQVAKDFGQFWDSLTPQSSK